MYIGSAYRCEEYCEEEEKRNFDKYHSKEHHKIHNVHDFKEDNKHLVGKGKHAWRAFAKRLRTLFRDLKQEI
jgi:putative lipase involved disintegration of autophagic bodies